MTDSQFIGSTNIRLTTLEKQMEAMIQDLQEIKYAINNHSEYIKAIIDTITGKTEEDECTDEEVQTAAEDAIDEMFEDMPEELREEAIEDYLE